MKLQIQSINFDADAKLLAFIEEKCAKLSKFFDRIVDGQVFLKTEKDREKRENKVVEIKLNVPGEVLIAAERGHYFEEATDLAVDNLKRQLVRYKEKLRTH